jgi:hypothetical protein
MTIVYCSTCYLYYKTNAFLFFVSCPLRSVSCSLGVLFDLVLLLGLVPVGAGELVDLLLEGHGDDGGEDEGGAHHVHPFGNHFKKCHLKIYIY